jgi:chromosome segregation protein
VVTAAAVEEAEVRAAHAAAAADAVATQLAERRRALEEARRAAIEAGRASDLHRATSSSLADELRRTDRDHERVVAELEEARTERDVAEARLGADVAAAMGLEASIDSLDGAAAGASARAQQAAAGKLELETRRTQLRSDHRDLDVRRAALVERVRVLEQRSGEVERRLAGHAEERAQAAVRRRRLEADATALRRLQHVVEEERSRLERQFERLQDAYRTQVEAVRAGGERLESLRHDRVAAEDRLGQVAERSRNLDLEIAQVTIRTEVVADSVGRELGLHPEQAMQAIEPELPDGVAAEEHATALAARLSSLGPVNPLALEELSALEERLRELEEQGNDIRNARRDLQQVVRELDDEIVQSFTSAVADVNEHFSSLVALLFPGGIGRLELTTPDDLLNTGVEVEVRPAGRNVRRVSLLSGGERALAALAFLFAVFRSRPSPFYLMDEVEAALDDVNLSRFLGLVRQFRDEAQLIIVSHQKRTMETGDALYGVTMAPGGSSQVVSQRVDKRYEARAPLS